MPQQISFQDTPYGKMFRDHSVRENRKEKTSDASSKSSSKSVSRTPRCLRLTRGGGHTQMSSWVTDGAWLIGFSMLNTGESPSVAVESTLSQVLIMNAPEKYYLSVKACQGILRRANQRGKELPKLLKDALEQQIIRMKTTEDAVKKAG